MVELYFFSLLVVENLEVGSIVNYRLKVELDVPECRQEIAKAILLNVEEVINCASTEDLQLIAKLPEKPEVSESERALAMKIAGQDYREGTSQELWCLEFANLLRLYRLRRRLLEGSLDPEQVMSLLDLQSQERVMARVDNNTLLAVKDFGVYKFSLWQFDPEGKWGVIDGLPEALAALDVSPLVKLNWLTKVHRAFEGRTPLDMLRLG